MVRKSLAKRYGANGGRGRMGQTRHEKRKGDGVPGAGWERCSAATEMERCCVDSGTQGAHVCSSRVRGVQRLCFQSEQLPVCGILPKLVLFLNKQNVGVKNSSMAGSRACMTCCQQGFIWRQEGTTLGGTKPDVLGVEINGTQMEPVAPHI